MKNICFIPGKSSIIVKKFEFGYKVHRERKNL